MQRSPMFLFFRRMKSDVRMLSSSPHKKSFVKISYISYTRQGKRQ